MWRGVARGRRLAGVLVLVLASAGCAMVGERPGARGGGVDGVTIAFESVEGPPPGLVQTLLRDLNQEAAARAIVIVPREQQALYRVRGYLAAPSGRDATVAWVWDIYDAGEQRAFRLRGEERAAARRSWAALDERVLRRIAHASAEQFAAFLSAVNSQAGPGPALSASAPSRRTSIVAAFDDFRPEAAGIFRVFRSQPPAAEAGSATTAAVPLPQHRPPPSAVAAFASNDPVP